MTYDEPNFWSPDDADRVTLQILLMEHWLRSASCMSNRAEYRTGDAIVAVRQ